MNIINRLDTYLLEKNKRKRTSHYPSDVNSCLRQLYYKWNNVDESDPPTAGNIIKMKFGTLAENIVRDYLQWEKGKGAIKDFAEQVEITGIEADLSYKIHGYQDFVITNKDNTLVGIECKSSFGRGIKEIQQSGPKEDHVLQVYQYMRYGEPKKYYLVYIGRDNGYRTQFEVHYKNGQITVNGKEYLIDWQYYLNRLISAEHVIGAAIMPYREYRTVIKDGEIKDKVQRNGEIYKSDWQCRYCNWRSLCHKAEIEHSRNTGAILYGGEEI